MKAKVIEELGLYPVLPLRDVVVFTKMIVPLFVGREKSIKALQFIDCKGAIDVNKGFKPKRNMKVAEIANQKTPFEILTISMTLEEAIQWAKNTTTFLPLIIEKVGGIAAKYWIAKAEPANGGRFVKEDETILVLK